jgi:hypothetical protein
MDCPVVRTIKELYGAYDYGVDDSADSITGIGNDNTGASTTKLLIPSGVSGGGTVSTDISMETMQFYITMRKLQFARAELIATQNNSVANSAAESTDITHALIDDSTHNTPAKTYFDRMFKDYRGKKSGIIFKEVFGPSARKIYTTITRSIDLIDIMESICSGSLARDFPSGMSLPTVCFDPAAIEVIELQPSCVYKEVNKIIDYANNLCVGGLRKKIDPLPKFDKTLRDFTFDIITNVQNTFALEEYKQLLNLDMEIAEYGMALEQYHCIAIKKLNEVMTLCQSIIDLAHK